MKGDHRLVKLGTQAGRVVVKIGCKCFCGREFILLLRNSYYEELKLRLWAGWKGMKLHLERLEFSTPSSFLSACFGILPV